MFSIFPGSVISVDSTIFGLLRIIFLIGFGLYTLFAFIALRQIEIMRKTVETPVSSIVRVIGYVHLALAIIMLFFVFSLLSV